MFLDFLGWERDEYFAGEFQPFTHLSYPVYAQVRLPVMGSIHAVVSGGTHFWPAFEEGDFGSVDTGVNFTEGEWTLWFGAGFEIVWD